MIEIGNVELPIVTSVEELDESEVTEIKSYLDSIPVKHKSSVRTISILGFVNEEIHSENLTLSEQKKELKTLRDKQKLDNPFVYHQYRGYLLVEEVEFNDNSDSRIVNEFEIVARYFPWPKYHSENKP